MLVFGIIVVAGLLFLFVPSIRSSNKRKDAGSDEVLVSDWRDWGYDDPDHPGHLAGFVAEPEEVPEPDYGVIRIQVR